MNSLSENDASKIKSNKDPLNLKKRLKHIPSTIHLLT